MQSASLRRNRFLLLQILLLDLIGFSVIFPIIPEMLKYYTDKAEGSAFDFWLPHAAAYAAAYLPDAAGSSGGIIVILGGLIASLYSLLQFLFTPFWGRLSDKSGRRPVLLITSAGLAFSYLLWFFSDSFTFFLLSRITGGIMAGNVGVATASMADMTTREERTSAMGLVGAAFGLGFVTGPLLGGLASKIDLSLAFPDYSFLHPFSFCALISFLMASLSALRNYTSFQETNPRSGVPSDHTWVTSPVAAVKSAGTDRNFYYSALIYFIFILMFSGFEFSLSFLYKMEFGLSPSSIGFVFLYSGFILIFGQGYLVRKLSAVTREKSVLLAGLSLMPLPLLFLAWTEPGLWFSLLMLLPVTLGASLVQPALSGIASLSSPAESQGLSMGSFRSAGSLARAIGPGISSLFFWAWGFTTAYAILTVFLIISVLLAVRLRSPARN